MQTVTALNSDRAGIHLEGYLLQNSLPRLSSGSLKICAKVESRTIGAGYMYCAVASIVLPIEINTFHFSQHDVH